MRRMEALKVSILLMFGFIGLLIIIQYDYPSVNRIPNLSLYNARSALYPSNKFSIFNPFGVSSEAINSTDDSNRNVKETSSRMLWKNMKNIPRSDDRKNGNDNLPVPNICHYTWYSKEKLQFRFHHYISVLSAYIYIKPWKMLFWYEIEPRGFWWEEIKRRVPVIEMKFRKAPTHIYGNPIHRPEHQSDVVRLEAVLTYGGIYHDLDVVVLKSFDPLRKYNITMGYESGNHLCNGIIISVPHARFLTMWHKFYKSFDDRDWGHHSVKLPGQLAKHNPHLIHTEERSLNRPNFEEREWIYGEGKIYDWSDNYALHLWYRFHDIDHNPEDIKTINTTMGQLFRYIYYGDKKMIFD